MAKVSFKTNSDTTTATATADSEINSAPSTAVVVSAPAAVSRPATFADDEDLNLEDVILPRINIVQKVGDLSNVFVPGEIVLNQQQVLHTPANPQRKIEGTPALNVVFLGFRPRQFVEKTEGGALGLMLGSEQDVVANNGTLDWKEWKQSLEASKQPGGPPVKRLFQRMATAILLIEKPESVPDPEGVNFPYRTSDGRQYAMALWSMKGTAYTHAAKIVFTARKIGCLKADGYPSYMWSLTTKCEQFGDNFAHVPVLKPSTRTSPELLSFIDSSLGLS